MKRITGTLVYSYVKCPRLAALDLSLDRSERRPPTEWEEFAARRGRDFEAAYVKGLGAVAPVYPERDFAAGAAATLALLRAGAPLIHQAVLLDADRLGLPDLLRRVPGGSALGEHHYEVIDVKTSGRPRSDQILQVVFYSRLLGDVQQRQPDEGALVMKDGREERFAIADYMAAGAEVEAALLLLRAQPETARPFRQAGCDSCHWSHRCLAELADAQDLSLVQGMSHGAREILEGLGCRTIADLAVFAADGARARGQLDAALVRRLRAAAHSALLGQPVPEQRPRSQSLDPAVIVHVLTDGFADRVLAFGMLSPAQPGGAFTCELPRDRADEWSAFTRLLAGVDERANLLHFGPALPHWYEEQAFVHESGLGRSARFVDLSRRLRAAALYPGPVFGLGDYVRHALQRDPLRAGHPGAAGLWATLPDGELRLRAKLQADLVDLGDLKAMILAAAPTREQGLGTAPGTAPAPLPGS